jgi:hypothetical protein
LTCAPPGQLKVSRTLFTAIRNFQKVSPVASRSSRGGGGASKSGRDYRKGAAGSQDGNRRAEDGEGQGRGRPEALRLPRRAAPRNDMLRTGIAAAARPARRSHRRASAFIGGCISSASLCGEASSSHGSCGSQRLRSPRRPRRDPVRRTAVRSSCASLLAMTFWRLVHSPCAP